ncbi:unnamed protein product [Amaranthus hypochondriacus]
MSISMKSAFLKIVIVLFYITINVCQAHFIAVATGAAAGAVAGGAAGFAAAAGASVKAKKDREKHEAKIKKANKNKEEGAFGKPGGGGLFHFGAPSPTSKQSSGSHKASGQYSAQGSGQSSMSSQSLSPMSKGASANPMSKKASGSNQGSGLFGLFPGKDSKQGEIPKVTSNHASTKSQGKNFNATGTKTFTHATAPAQDFTEDSRISSAHESRKIPIINGSSETSRNSQSIEAKKANEKSSSKKSSEFTKGKSPIGSFQASANKFAQSSSSPTSSQASTGASFSFSSNSKPSGRKLLSDSN